MTIILRNDFHNTETRVLAQCNALTSAQLQRAKRVLCGVEGCTCGGIRGRQSTPANNQIVIIPRSDGGAWIEKAGV